jgi:hypothetical protein
MEMTLKVVNDNQITGSGEVRGVARGKGRAYHPVIAGTVEGEKVTLDLHNPRSGNNVKLELSRVDGMLKGSRKGEEVVYKKQD